MSNGIIGWVGGKSRIAKQIIDILPPHDEYYEVFMGGAALFFAKPKAEVNYLNDINRQLVNLFKVCAIDEYFNRFTEILEWLPYSRGIHEQVIKTLRQDSFEEVNVIEAVKYFYAINTSYNKMIGSGFSNMVHKSDGIRSSLMRAKNKLKNVVIECLDYKEFVNKYVDVFQEKSQLFYFDPPYVVANKTKYYEYNFTPDDHIELASLLKDLNDKRVKIVLSYDDDRFIREIYSELGFEIKVIEVVYPASAKKDISHKTATELLITNFEQKKRNQLTLW